MPSMAIHVISHAVHTSQDRWYLVWRDFVRTSRRTTDLIIWPYCGKRRSLIYSSLRSGQQGDHHCGRSAIGAEKTFLIPSNITLEGLVAYIFWNLAWYYLTYIWQRKPWPSPRTKQVALPVLVSRRRTTRSHYCYCSKKPVSYLQPTAQQRRRRNKYVIAAVSVVRLHLLLQSYQFGPH